MSVSWNGTAFGRLLVDARVSINDGGLGAAPYNATSFKGRGEFTIETVTASGSGQAPLKASVSELVGEDDTILTDTIKVTPRAGGMFRVIYATDDGCRYGSDDAVFMVTCNAKPEASTVQQTYISTWDGDEFPSVRLNATTSSDADQDALDLTWELNSVQLVSENAFDFSPFPAAGSPELELNDYYYRFEVLGDSGTTLAESSTFANGGTSGIASLTPKYLGTWEATATASDRCSDDSTTVQVRASCPRAATLRLESRVLLSHWNDSSRSFGPVVLNATRTTGLLGNLSGLLLEMEYSDFVGPLESAAVAARVRMPPNPLPAVVPENDPAATDPGLDSPSMNTSSGFLLEYIPTLLGESYLLVSVTDGCTVVETNVTVRAIAGLPPDPQAANVSALESESSGHQHVGHAPSADGVDDDDSIDVLIAPWRTNAGGNSLPLRGQHAFETVKLGSDGRVDPDTPFTDIDLHWTFLQHAAGPLARPGAVAAARTQAALDAAESLAATGAVTQASSRHVYSTDAVLLGELGPRQAMLSPDLLSVSAGAAFDDAIEVGILSDSGILFQFA